MDWKELERMVAKRSEIDPNREDDAHYQDALSKLNWDAPVDAMPENADVLLKFLARYDPGSRAIDSQQLQDVWLESVETIAADLEDVTLGHLHVLEHVDRPGENVFCVGDVISRMYEHVKSIQGVGMTNASRLLHLRFPALFVMTDELMRKFWEDGSLPGVFNISSGRLFEPYGYAFIFLPAMSIQAVDAIMSCSLDGDISVEDATEKLQGLGGEQGSIAKLVSDYYYAMTAAS